MPLAKVLLSLVCAWALTACTAPVSSNAPAGELNHLADQKSPYLLQHARNPVDWYPWSDEALDKARSENKLLVISIGYAACHWCHVMEHESFEDSTVAALMNDHFVSIKVDREERPDIDDVYMSACQLTNERGCGWPLNAIALPDGRPIWTGTYFPKDQWLTILDRFRELHGKDQAQMETYAGELTAALNKQNQPAVSGSAPLSYPELSPLISELADKLDDRLGGIRGAPKFPTPVLYEFLLAHQHYVKDERTFGLVRQTLDKMADGGIYDHLAGGFARYSTDAEWKVPHFEKMLYDNAQLISLYSKAYQLTGHERYADVVRQTIGFVRASLTGENGLFYASLDADTEGEEGKTYVWTEDEIDGIITDPAEAATFKAYYSVRPRGNWEGRNILYRETYDPSVEAGLEDARRELLSVRDRRTQPGLDDKALTAWNALMISALATAYRALGEESYRADALRAAEFLRDHLLHEDGRLDRNYKDGSSGINAFLDDYALFAQACVDLYQITFDEGWMETADELLTYADEHFYNREAGLYNYTSDLDPPLVSVNLPVIDQAMPSGNSVIARALYQTGILLGDDDRKARAGQLLATVSPRLRDEGLHFLAGWGRLALEIDRPTYEVAILGEDAGAMRGVMSKEFHPNVLYLGGKTEGHLDLLTNKLVPGETTIYVCLEKVCQLPVNEPGAALAQIR